MLLKPVASDADATASAPDALSRVRRKYWRVLPSTRLPPTLTTTPPPPPRRPLTTPALLKPIASDTNAPPPPSRPLATPSPPTPTPLKPVAFDADAAASPPPPSCDSDLLKPVASDANDAASTSPPPPTLYRDFDTPQAGYLRAPTTPSPPPRLPPSPSRDFESPQAGCLRCRRRRLRPRRPLATPTLLKTVASDTHVAASAPDAVSRLRCPRLPRPSSRLPPTPTRRLRLAPDILSRVRRKYWLGFTLHVGVWLLLSPSSALSLSILISNAPLTTPPPPPPPTPSRDSNAPQAGCLRLDDAASASALAPAPSRDSVALDSPPLKPVASGADTASPPLRLRPQRPLATSTHLKPIASDADDAASASVSAPDALTLLRCSSSQLPRTPMTPPPPLTPSRDSDAPRAEMDSNLNLKDLSILDCKNILAGRVSNFGTGLR
ncbi:formin-like protein 14 [Eucalyptus grandis]|uniref:formin-like protein 14 n=1 Tax=Eucalyptus grandis TaxID=71139 RepID=UPI00192E7FC3|nr:formin-like protein 14 [Eucalyptus grandis]